MTFISIKSKIKKPRFGTSSNLRHKTKKKKKTSDHRLSKHLPRAESKGVGVGEMIAEVCNCPRENGYFRTSAAED